MANASRQAFLEMCADAPVQVFESGAVLMNEGDAGDFCYVVISGRFSIQVATAGTGAREIATRGRGELIGEMSLFNKTRIATVKALGRSACVRLPHGVMLQMFANKPSLALALLAATMEKARESVLDRN